MRGCRVDVSVYHSERLVVGFDRELAPVDELVEALTSMNDSEHHSFYVSVAGLRDSEGSRGE